jgi:hypothetical protein
MFYNGNACGILGERKRRVWGDTGTQGLSAEFSLPFYRFLSYILKEVLPERQERKNIRKR